MVEKIKLEGGNMSTRIVKAQSALFIGVIFVSTALFILVLGGCASTPPGPGPGTPDEMQMQHYEMLKSAIARGTRVVWSRYIPMAYEYVDRGGRDNRIVSPYRCCGQRGVDLGKQDANRPKIKIQARMKLKNQNGGIIEWCIIKPNNPVLQYFVRLIRQQQPAGVWWPYKYKLKCIAIQDVGVMVSGVKPLIPPTNM